MKGSGKRFETFNDGILDICETKERSIVKTRLANVRFGNRTVGVTRFYQAKVADEKIDRMVVVPWIPEFSAEDMIIINGTQYVIKQIQEKFDASPPCRYLTLTESAIRYKDVRI